MNEPFAESFYNSSAWQSCRKAYTKYRRGLCEACLAKGIVKAGEQVHHKIHLTPSNIDDPSITLNWDNLMLLCKDCHADIHSKRSRQRYFFDNTGRCITKKE